MTGDNGADLPHRVLVLADPSVLGPAWVDRVARVVGEGLPWVLLRTPGRSSVERIAGVRTLRERCPNAVIVGYEDPGVAEAEGMEWLHLPGRRLGDLAAIGRAHPGLRVGVSCHRREDLVRAADDGAAYALLSPVFSPRCKSSDGPPLGVDGFGGLIPVGTLPVLALGGIIPDRVPETAAAGAAGVAVLGSLFSSGDDLEHRAREYRCAAGRAWSGTIHGEPR